MKETPVSIKNYLLKLDRNQLADGYLCLNEKQDIVASAGWVGQTDLSHIDRTKKPEQLIPVLEGLLPSNSAVPIIIEHAHVDQNYYFNIHLFNDYAGAWVLFIDTTRSANLLQKEQQIRLAVDFNNDKRRLDN